MSKMRDGLFHKPSPQLRFQPDIIYDGTLIMARRPSPQLRFQPDIMEQAESAVKERPSPQLRFQPVIILNVINVYFD